MAQDIILTPHCDMHVAMSGTPQLQIKVFERDFKKDAAMPNGVDKRRYELKEVTASCTYAFLAPYEPVGSRLTSFVTIDGTGKVTPTGPGINLIQVSYKDSSNIHHYIIVRIQVHTNILGWWFGIPSLTVAKDPLCAHTQVSIYASFSADAKRTDLVGDITGHGYVNLASNNNSLFEPDANGSGRIWGKNEGNGSLAGTFLGTTKNIPVKVVDYAKQKNTLDPVQHEKTFTEAHNFLFLPEGFRDTVDDKKKFDKLVTNFIHDVFQKPRHAPFNLLKGSFNVFKAYQPSNQHVTTFGCHINDEDDPKLAKGQRAPNIHVVTSGVASPYSPEILVMKVGLPLRNETRSASDLRALWSSQLLDDFNAANVDDDLVSVWKKQRSAGILEARDTFFGLIYGVRYADQNSKIGPAATPAADAGQPMKDFIKKMYQWFYTAETRVIGFDPRRHSPEVYKSNQNNPSNIVMQYVGSLHNMYDAAQHIGQEWIPDVNGNIFKPSVGFIGILVNDRIHGGGNLNSSTMTSFSIAQETVLNFVYVNNGAEKILRRNPANDLDIDYSDVIDTMAHEFGHSFYLGDEYETFSGDKFDQFDLYDNVANLKSIQLDGSAPADRVFDPDKVKWLELLRIELSSKLIADSVTDSGLLKVKIDPIHAGKWVEAKQFNKQVDIRRKQITSEGQQLPLSFKDDHYLVRLDIIKVDAAGGFISLGGAELPPLPLPVFPKGSFIFVPLRDENGNLAYVIDGKVMNYLKNDPANKHRPLNKDTDHVKKKDKKDEPKSIPGFKPPCDEHRTIGVYEGGNYHSGMNYRPAGNCKMRTMADTDGGGEFCHVCKYLIVNRVDPGLHGDLDKKYYPKTKKK